MVQPGNRVWIALFFGYLIVYPITTGGTAWAQPEPKPQSSPDKAAEIKVLLKDRRETVKRVVVILLIQYKGGLVNLQSVFQAERDLLRATLDLEDSPEAHMEAIRAQLKMADDFAKIAEKRFKNGNVSEVDVLRAREGVLEARIELLREELKAKPSK
jgi:outer membrane protein TolC